MPELVVVTGPIGSGKSSVTKMLGDRLKEAGRSAAVVDLDDIVAMLHAPLENVGPSWERARDVHGRLVGEWLSSGVDVVIVDGPFYSQSETAALMQCVPTGIAAHRVMLLSTYEMALARVSGDPTRGVSKDPAILRLLYEEFARELPNIDPCEWTFDTAECSVGDVVTTVARVLLEGRRPQSAASAFRNGEGSGVDQLTIGCGLPSPGLKCCIIRSNTDRSS